MLCSSKYTCISHLLCDENPDRFSHATSCGEKSNSRPCQPLRRCSRCRPCFGCGPRPAGRLSGREARQISRRFIGTRKRNGDGDGDAVLVLRLRPLQVSGLLGRIGTKTRASGKRPGQTHNDYHRQQRARKHCRARLSPGKPGRSKKRRWLEPMQFTDCR